MKKILALTALLTASTCAPAYAGSFGGPSTNGQERYNPYGVSRCAGCHIYNDRGGPNAGNAVGNNGRNNPGSGGSDKPGVSQKQ